MGIQCSIGHVELQVGIQCSIGHVELQVGIQYLGTKVDYIAAIPYPLTALLGLYT